jgi:hypothetical protein
VLIAVEHRTFVEIDANGRHRTTESAKFLGPFWLRDGIATVA